MIVAIIINLIFTTIVSIVWVNLLDKQKKE